MPGSLAGLIERVLADIAAPAGRPAGASAPIALGWATVDLDRAIPELALELGLEVGRFGPTVASEILGARGVVASGAIGGETALVILEPATEGRLAEALARSGEGPVAIWFDTEAAADRPVGAAADERAGPFGTERLVPGGRVDGLYRFLVLAWPGTIRA